MPWRGDRAAKAGKGGPRLRVAVGVLAAVAPLAAPVGASDGTDWLVRIPRAGSVQTSPAFDARGNVFVVVSPRNLRLGWEAVSKLSARTGAQRWQRRLHGPGRPHRDQLESLAVTSTGDAVVAGTVTVDDQGSTSWLVARVAGSNGHVVWRRMLSGGAPSNGNSAFGPQSAHGVAVDPSGDVLVAGSLLEPDGTLAPGVVKLAGDTGEERWRFVLSGVSHGYAAALQFFDVAGEIQVYAALGGVSDGQPGTVLMLDPVDGHLLSRVDLSGGRIAPQATFRDPSGELVLAGWGYDVAASPFTVMKFSGTTGHIMWSNAISVTEGHWQTAYGVARLPNGDVVTVGFTGSEENNSSVTPVMPFFTVVAYDGATGVERWRQLLRGTAGFGEGHAVAVTPSGGLFVAGTFRDALSCYDGVLIGLAPSTGSVVSSRLFDGTAQSKGTCETPCGGSEDPGGCHPVREGIDQDSVGALAVAPSGNLVVAGVLTDAPHGSRHAFVASVPGD